MQEPAPILALSNLQLGGCAPLWHHSSFNSSPWKFQFWELLSHHPVFIWSARRVMKDYGGKCDPVKKVKLNVWSWILHERLERPWTSSDYRSWALWSLFSQYLLLSWKNESHRKEENTALVLALQDTSHALSLFTCIWGRAEIRKPFKNILWNLFVLNLTEVITKESNKWDVKKVELLPDASLLMAGNTSRCLAHANSEICWLP